MKDNIFLLILLGFLASCVFDVACPRHAEGAVVPASAGQYWDVSITAHKDNVGLDVVTECYQGTKLAYRSVDSYDIEPDMTRVLVRQSGPLPKSATCTIVFYVMRNPKHDGNPESETFGESARLTLQTKLGDPPPRNPFGRKS